MANLTRSLIIPRAEIPFFVFFRLHLISYHTTRLAPIADAIKSTQFNSRIVKGSNFRLSFNDELAVIRSRGG